MQDPQIPQHSEQKRIGASMFALMWVGIFVILGIFFSDILDKQNNPNQSANTLSLNGDIKELVLKRNRMGHYVANGSINSQPVTFMLDTGATDVAIPEAIARRLNLTRGPSATYQTANGNVQVYLTRLDEVSLGDTGGDTGGDIGDDIGGGIRLSNIRATINPGYKSDEILLGMSFLKHLEFSQRGNTLTLRQYPEGL